MQGGLLNLISTGLAYPNNRICWVLVLTQSGNYGLPASEVIRRAAEEVFGSGMVEFLDPDADPKRRFADLEKSLLAQESRLKRYIIGPKEISPEDSVEFLTKITMSLEGGP